VPSFRAYPISNNRKVAAAPSVVIVCENDEDGLRQAQQLEQIPVDFTHSQRA
jgi:hypothetical protein